VFCSKFKLIYLLYFKSSLYYVCDVSFHSSFSSFLRKKLTLILIQQISWYENLVSAQQQLKFSCLNHILLIFTSRLCDTSTQLELLAAYSRVIIHHQTLVHIFAKY